MTQAQTAALRATSKATERRDAARLAWELAIVHARNAGCTLQAIAGAAGVTHQQVMNIIRKHASLDE